MKIAFTSCMRYSAFGNDQPVWGRILTAQPDYVFLLGDQIYMDYGYFGDEALGEPAFWGTEKFLTRMRQKYEEQWAVPGFAELLKRYPRGERLFGIWDDHDFAWNNAYGNCVPLEKKNGSRTLFHEFMKCSKDFAAGKMRDEVYYHVDLIENGARLARVFFLDNRYYAMPQEKCEKCIANCAWHADDGTSLFGHEQMDYVRALIDPSFRYTIFCTGLTATQGSSQLCNWGQSYEEFLQIVRTAPRPILLAGDIHDNRFMPPSKATDKIQRPFYEIISSGASQRVAKVVGVPIMKRENWASLELTTVGASVTFLEGTKPTHKTLTFD